MKRAAQKRGKGNVGKVKKVKREKAKMFRFRAPVWKAVGANDTDPIDMAIRSLGRDPSCGTDGKGLDASEQKELIDAVYTENNAPSHSSAGMAVLDLFFRGMVRGAGAKDVKTMAGKAWRESPRLALQVLMNGRDCRSGKGEREVVYNALRWLRRAKPVTYLLNLRRFLELGYYKDLLNLAVELTLTKAPLLGHNDLVELEVLAHDLRTDMRAIGVFDAQVSSRKGKGKGKGNGAEVASTVDEFLQVLVPNQDRMDVDEDDEEKKAKGAPTKSKVHVSLAGKWAPTEKSHFDRKAALAKRVARLLFPKSKGPMKLYRKKIGALREHVNVVERLMCQGQWADIDFSQVPSKAHHLLKKAFKKHDPERYQAYLQALASGKTKINTTGLGPHLLTKQYINGAEVDPVVEAQWTTIVSKLKKAGKLQGALSLVDVSGSMSGTPMQVAIALGLITAELSKGPFKHRVITFSEDPRWHSTCQSTLAEKVKSMMNMPWGMSTNLQKAFDMILAVARQHNVCPQDMPKTLFIYSDMQFGGAVPGETNFQACQRKYAQHGYEVPQVVFWNLNGRISDSPVTMNDTGVALISGFSPELLKTFMEDVDFTPLGVLKAAVGGYEVEVDPKER